MVARKTAKSTSINGRHASVVFVVGFLVVCAGVFAILGALNVFSDRGNESAVQDSEEQGKVEEKTEVASKPEESVEEKLPEKIDFQEVVETWAGSVGGNRSVLIYDLDRGETVGSYNPLEDYGTASLYKLFVVYEGYRRVQSGEWDGEAKAGSTGYTINKCLDLAIRESYSPCAETLWAMLGHDTLDIIIENDYGIVNSDISHLVSNAGDILKIMQRFYAHPDFSDEKMVAAMWDSFLVQPVTTYNWRQGLPSGFSERAKVYNKVGWEYNSSGRYWNIYHDAAIVSFPEDTSSGTPERHFVVVVMTNRVDYSEIAKLGRMLEAKYFQSK